jgi:hypothetical protein
VRALAQWKTPSALRITSVTQGVCTFVVGRVRFLALGNSTDEF